MNVLEILVVVGSIVFFVGGTWTVAVGNSRLKERHRGSRFWGAFYRIFLPFETHIDCWSVTKIPIIVEGFGIALMVVAILLMLGEL
jgi:hypothetical protein